MAFQVIVHWPVQPGSVWDCLAKRLGREPTSAEIKAEIRRIVTR
jgi:hypothetical protein